ncbi:MAG: magnesium transporter CorA family protein [Limnochordaceae bacterium]|nr:magnesium transporter CorA family protein [Limnochordaceae bacterium]
MTTQVYLTRDGRLGRTDDLSARNSWVVLTAPAPEELERVERELDIPPDFLRAALDEEEQPRVEVDGQRVLVLLRGPVLRGDPAFPRYETLPLAVIVTPAHLVTVCLEPMEIVESLAQQGRVHTAKRTQFLMHVMYRTATLFLRYLRLIDRRSDELERSLQHAMKNAELIRLLELEKSLVYFSTSLRANQIVMDKLLRLHLKPGEGAVNGEQASAAVTTEPGVLRLYDEDREFLEDVITENRQALEMADVYSNILSSTMDAFASIIANNLNVVMKFLTSVTIVLAVPTIVASTFGMNVTLPLQDHPLAFWFVVGLTVVLSGGAAWWLGRRGMF